MPRTRTSFQRGSKHPRWKGGKTLTSDGYYKINTYKGRDMLEHRAVMLEMLEEPVSYMLRPDMLGDGYTVHHNDHNKTHNCQGNLMLLQKCIHDAISNSYRSYILANYSAYLQWLNDRSAPDWVTE